MTGPPVVCEGDGETGVAGAGIDQDERGADDDDEEEDVAVAARPKDGEVDAVVSAERGWAALCLRDTGVLLFAVGEARPRGGVFEDDEGEPDTQRCWGPTKGYSSRQKKCSTCNSTYGGGYGGNTQVEAERRSSARSQDGLSVREAKGEVSAGEARRRAARDDVCAKPVD